MTENCVSDMEFPSNVRLDKRDGDRFSLIDEIFREQDTLLESVKGFCDNTIGTIDRFNPNSVRESFVRKKGSRRNLLLLRFAGCFLSDRILFLLNLGGYTSLLGHVTKNTGNSNSNLRGSLSHFQVATEFLMQRRQYGIRDFCVRMTLNRETLKTQIADESIQSNIELFHQLVKSDFCHNCLSVCSGNKCSPILCG